ncbi:FTR1 family protein [Xanthobacter autotrophicus DSM 431]|uniref:FTR1 family iron permease n=1 Tax=Xanthobacter nonsaccharivorans TaxID=3119912 RepID=UPI0037283E5C
MIAALLIVFREVLEAGIVIGVVLAASEGIRHRGKWITLGVAGGLAGSGILALFADQIAGTFEGSGQDILNAGILAVAVVMLVWTVVWMATHGRKKAAEMKELSRRVQEGEHSLPALAVVVGMAVLREGVEVVLFLFGFVSTGAETAGSVALGGLLGLAGGAAVSLVLYLGLVTIPLRHLFKVTAVLMTLLAAGLAAQVVGILQDAGFIQSLADPVWNSSWLLADDGAVGRVLRTLVGYRAQPTGMQLAAYLGTVAFIVVCTRLANGRPSAHRPSARAPRTAAEGRPA